MSSALAKASPEQRQAIEFGPGQMMVIAGPGSGKTFVLTHRILHLIRERGVKPENILVITFTRAAASGMKERFTDLNDGEELPVNFGTFHSIFYNILKSSYKFSSGDILSEGEKFRIITEVLNFSSSPYASKSEAILAHIGKEKNFGKECPLNIPGITRQEYLEIEKAYKRACNQRHKLDFDDMALFVAELFERKPQVLEFYRDKFRYILVDEYQDINSTQFKVISMLCGNAGNLFVVGDDDQSIYSFRGSDPGLMLGFPGLFPNARTVSLTVNHRCSGNIVDAAGMVIEENKNRFKKDIRSGRESGGEVSIKAFPDREAMYNSIVKMLKGFCADASIDDTCILFRTNTMMQHISERLMHEKIPFTMKEKTTNIYETQEGKDIIAILSFVFRGHKRKDFLRFMNKPQRYIERDALREEVVDMESLQAFYLDVENAGIKGVAEDDSCSFFDYYEKEQQKERAIRRKEVYGNLLKLEKNLEFIKKCTPFLAINYIRKGMEYEKFCLGKCHGDTMEKKKKTDLLDDIQKNSKACRDVEEWLKFIEDYSENQQKDRKSDDRGVKIMTMHASKGLEYKRVIIPEVQVGVIPHGKLLDKAQTEEERRMFYVAMTRAKDELYIFYEDPSQGDERKKRDTATGPSPFIRPLIKALGKQ